jgi:hypothetical protein
MDPDFRLYRGSANWTVRMEGLVASLREEIGPQIDAD